MAEAWYAHYGIDLKFPVKFFSYKFGGNSWDFVFNKNYISLVQFQLSWKNSITKYVYLISTWKSDSFISHTVEILISTCHYIEKNTIKYTLWRRTIIYYLSFQ